MKNIVASVLVVSAVLASPAFAQDKQANQPADAHAGQAKVSPTAANGSGGLTMAQTATAKIKFVTAQPAEITSQRLVGKNLYNNNNENVGEIEDFVIENGKTISGVVVSVGGFLGLGERYVLVDPSSIFLHKADGSLKAIVDTDKDTLKNAPAYHYDKKRT